MTNEQINEIREARESAVKATERYLKAMDDYIAAGKEFLKSVNDHIAEQDEKRHPDETEIMYIKQSPSANKPVTRIGSIPID